jgi:hypothetical protein
VVAVVRDLLDRLGGDGGELLVGGAPQPLVELAQVRREHQQPDHRDTEVAPGPLDEVHVAEPGGVAQVGQVVLGAGWVLQGAGVGQQGPGLAEQVERDVAQRDVLLDLRRSGDPLPGPLRRDQRVVGEREDVGLQGRHRCSTPSGMS